MADIVYLQLSESVLAEKRKVTIKDVSKVVSENLDLKCKIEKNRTDEFFNQFQRTAGDFDSGYY